SLLAHQPELALRFDVLVIELEHLVVALRRQLQIAHHLRHVPEKEVRRQAIVEHLDRLPAIVRALFVRRLPILREQELRVPAPCAGSATVSGCSSLASTKKLRLASADEALLRSMPSASK